MYLFSTATIVILTLLNSVILDNSGPENHRNGGREIGTRQYSYGRNCSTLYPSTSSFKISQFLGNWNYVRLSTATPLLTEPNCLKLTASTENKRLTMDIQVPKDGDVVRASILGLIEEDARSEAEWTIYSQVSMAPSNWIVLSGDERLVLYMICGDYPDSTTAVGEIGILSHNINLAEWDEDRFRKILAKHGLNDELGLISHKDCPIYTGLNEPSSYVNGISCVEDMTKPDTPD